MAQTLYNPGTTVAPSELEKFVVVANLPLNGDAVDQAIFIAPFACEIIAADYVNAVAGTDAGAVNCQLTKDTGTNAPGAGTDLLTNASGAGFNCKGTANTVEAATLTATQATKQFAAGNRLSLDFAGTTTALAGVQITATFKRI